MENDETIIVDDAEKTENQEQELEEKTDIEVDSEKEELKKKLKTLEAQREHWKKKATEKKDVSSDKPFDTNNLSFKDSHALIKAEVHEDDVDEVVEYANFKKISVAEALKSDVIKTMLSNKAEFRKTAQVTNTIQARKGATKQTEETLLSNLSKGQIPESKEDAERIFWARRGGKR